MSRFEQKRIDLELRAFTSRNFRKPTECKTLEQIRYCIRQLCLKIEELKSRSNYVPDWAYALLAQYNARQNSILLEDFINTYRY